MFCFYDKMKPNHTVETISSSLADCLVFMKREKQMYPTEEASNDQTSHVYRLTFMLTDPPSL